MEELSKVDKFVIGTLWQDYFGAIYYSSGKESPEQFLARELLRGVIEEGDRRFNKVYQEVIKSLQKLKDSWVIEISGYEIKLTIYGQQLAKEISKEELQKIKAELSKGRI